MIGVWLGLIGFDYGTFNWLRRANKFLQLFPCPGRGILDFKWQGWWNGAKIKTPKKSLDQNLAPKKSHAEFPSLKNFQKALNDITRKIETLLLNTPKKSLVNQATQKKACQNLLTQNNPKSKISNPQKILWLSLSLEIQSTPLSFHVPLLLMTGFQKGGVQIFCSKKPTKSGHLTNTVGICCLFT